MIDKKTVKHVAELARIELTEEEANRFSKELNDILENFKILDELNVDDVEPSFHPIRTENRVREDEPEQSLNREYLLNQAVHREEEYFKVPRIV